MVHNNMKMLMTNDYHHYVINITAIKTPIIIITIMNRIIRVTDQTEYAWSRRNECGVVIIVLIAIIEVFIDRRLSKYTHFNRAVNKSNS